MKKLLLIVTLLLPALLFTGCWDLTEPEDVGLIMVLGINLTDKNQIEIVTQDETLIPGGQQIQKSNWTFDVHKSTGSSIYDAIQNNSKINPEKFYFTHTKVIIVSEELAKSQGIKPVIDFLQRNVEIRQNTLFLISKKGEFEKIFLPDAKLDIDTGSIIEKIVNNRSSNSFVFESKLKNFLELSWRSYCNPYALGVGSVKSFVDNKSIEQGYDNIKQNTYDIDVGDIAVFKNNKMAGWLTGDESRGLLWGNGKVAGGNIDIDYDGNKISLRITRTNSKITPTIINGKMKIDMDVNVETNLEESYTDINFNDKNVIDKVIDKIDGQVKSEIEKTIEASKKYSVDVFNCGSRFYEEYPNYWKQVSKNWDNDYQKMDININVTSNINHIGLTKKPAKTLNNLN